MALRCRRTINCVEIWCLVASRGVDIWVSFTAEDSRVLGVLEFSFILMFWNKKNIIEESWNIILNFSTFHVGGCWGQLMLLFWNLVQETQMSTPLEATRHHISTQLLVLLHLRAIYFSTFQYETPCIRATLISTAVLRFMSNIVDCPETGCYPFRMPDF